MEQKVAVLAPSFLKEGNWIQVILLSQLILAFNHKFSYLILVSYYVVL